MLVVLAQQAVNDGYALGWPEVAAIAIIAVAICAFAWINKL